MDKIAVCEPVPEITEYVKTWNFKYLVHIEAYGLNTGVKSYCKTIDEAKEFADRYLVDDFVMKNALNI